MEKFQNQPFCPSAFEESASGIFSGYGLGLLRGSVF
jgi:hypothetical protein